MTVLRLDDIIRKEDGLYYRRKFSASAVYELASHSEDGRIEFVIETSPLGQNSISVKLIDDVNYPILPVKRALKEYINDLDMAGMLP